MCVCERDSLLMIYTFNKEKTNQCVLKQWSVCSVRSHDYLVYRPDVCTAEGSLTYSDSTVITKTLPKLLLNSTVGTPGIRPLCLLTLWWEHFNHCYRHYTLCDNTVDEKPKRTCTASLEVLVICSISKDTYQSDVWWSVIDGKIFTC